MNLSFVHTVAASLPNSGHPLLSMGEFCPDIPCPSHELSQLKLNFLKRCQLQLRLRIKKNSKALNTTFYKLRIRRHFWLIEYPAYSTQVHTFPYRRGRSWSITSFFSFQSRLRSQQGTNLLPQLCSTLPCLLIRSVIPGRGLLVLLQSLSQLGLWEIQ